MPARLAPPTAAVTLPEIEPPAAMAALIEPVVDPGGDETALAENGEGWSLYHWVT